jgi:phosphopantothenoylcysteine decarboxylase/phosphopantothenate--cysteine ligase
MHGFREVPVDFLSNRYSFSRRGKVAEQQIKKDESVFSIQLVKNTDIAQEFGKVKRNDQLSAGFALETNDELTHALGKLKRKNFDMVILNSMNDAGATFGTDTNKITVIKNDFTRTDYPLRSKREVAEDIVYEVETALFLQAIYAGEETLEAYEMMFR